MAESPKIGLISHHTKGPHATHSFSKEFLRCIPNSTLLHVDKLSKREASGERNYLRDFDILFVNRSQNLTKINLNRIPRKTQVVLWAHGIYHIQQKANKAWLDRCNIIGYVAPAAYDLKSGFLLEYGVCPFPTTGLTNPYRHDKNILYAGRIYGRDGSSNVLTYLHAASKLGNLHIISVNEPPHDLDCHYLGPMDHGTFTQYYLYADASLDGAHQPNRTLVNCKVLDCIYYGLPVVVSGPFGGDYWIKESGCGIVTEEASESQFTEAMREVVNDPWRFRYAQPRLDKSLTWEERFKKCWLTKGWMDHGNAESGTTNPETTSTKV